MEIGESVNSLRRVDLWAAGEWLTCDDNVAFVAQFRSAVRDTAAWVRSGHGSPLPFTGLSPAATHRRLYAGVGEDGETEEGNELRSEFRFLDRWGPTTDNLLAMLFRDGDNLVITLEFWREEHLRAHAEHVGEVFVIEIQATEFAGILEDLVAALDQGQGPRVIR